MERKWWTLWAVCVATFMLLLDITVVNVALPDIQEDLGSSFEDLQWVVDAYALTLAALLLNAGALADLLGRRRVFALGLGLFTLASLLCGLAHTPLALNLARALQGVGGAAMFACSLALIAQEFQGRDRGTAFAAWGASTGAAVAVGPVVGGVLTEWLGWEWIFFVNIPIGAGAVWVTLTRLAESRDADARGVDWAGLVTFSGALFMLVFALIRGNAEGWDSTLIVSLLIGSALLLAAFLVVELRQERPMLDLALFRKPTFGGASIVAFALSAAMFAMFLYLTLYIQNALGYSALEAGVRFLPITLLAFFVAIASGRLSAHLPVRWFLSGGLACVGAGLLLMRLVEPDSDWTVLLPGFVFCGIGIGLINPPLASTAIGVVTPQRSGMASGINSTFRQVGIATGIAALGAVFQSHVETRASELLAGTAIGRGGQAEAVAGAIASGEGAEALGSSAPPGSRGQLEEVVRVAVVDGLDDILLIGALIAFAGAILAIGLVRTRDFVTAPDAVSEPAAA